MGIGAFPILQACTDTASFILSKNENTLGYYNNETSVVSLISTRLFYDLATDVAKEPAALYMVHQFKLGVEGGVAPASFGAH